MEIRERKFKKEFVFNAVRSGGKGGQNVNKVSTKIELYFNLYNPNWLSEEEKNILSTKLKEKISLDGNLRITAQKERSQYLNKLDAIEKFYTLLENSFKKKKKRKNTKPTLISREDRLFSKKIKSEKKAGRSRNFIKEID